jgi:hypothetical protein
MCVLALRRDVNSRAGGERREERNRRKWSFTWTAHEATLRIVALACLTRLHYMA